MGTEVLIGKTYGIDGMQLLQVDGPHAAPCQHYKEYETCLVVGAGIGITPGSCILKSILRYKWRKGANPKRLYFAWVNRWSNTIEYQWFILLLTKLFNRLGHDRKIGIVSKDQTVFTWGVNKLQRLGNADLKMKYSPTLYTPTQINFHTTFSKDSKTLRSIHKRVGEKDTDDDAKIMDDEEEGDEKKMKVTQIATGQMHSFE